MHVTFGLDLDGGSFPGVLGDCDAMLGRAHVGPGGLLRLLETHCGLLADHGGEAVRIAAYAERLAAGDAADRFFHRSLERDRWGTARTLLSWRDALVLAGWEGGRCGEPRVDALAGIEAISSPPLPAGQAERLRGVLRTLPGVRLPFQRITCVEPLALLPPIWRDVLSACRVPIEEVAAPGGCRVSSDLAALQAVLLDPAAPPTRPAGDRSVVRLRGADPWQTAEALAAWMAANPYECVVVRGGMGQVLDQALRRYGLPTLGSASRSAFRPATQVLALAFAVAWRPLDPYRLLEMLTLPVSPLPGRAAAVLARAFRERPGVQGEFWARAWEEAVEAVLGGASDGAVEGTQNGAPTPYCVPSTAPGDDSDRAAEVDLLIATGPARQKRENTPKKIRNKLERWLGPQALAVYDADDGIPREAAQEIAGRVAQWAEGRARVDGDRVAYAAARQARDLREILAISCRSDTIPRDQIEQMLDYVQSSGSTAYAVPAEAGRAPCVDGPGAVIADAPTVIWWNFSSPPDARPARTPWSDAERQALGLPLDDALSAMRRAAWRWRQPVLRATRRLILATPATVADHPLYDEIRARFCPTREDEARVTASLLEDGSVPVERIPVRAPDRPGAAWRIPADLAAAPAVESASSLESLLACPLQWILRYVLHLRGDADLADGNRLHGSLAHDVLEELLPPGPIRMDPQEAHNRAVAAFDRRLPEQATPLLLPERTVERLKLRESLGRAAGALIQALRAFGLEVIGTEVEREVALPEFTLRGRLDVLLDGGIIDLKFGQARYLRPKLEDGSSVQLATYAKLAELPRVGYFSVTSAELLMAEEPAWDRVVAGRSRRLMQVGDGVVEATGHPDAVPDLEPPCGVCDYPPICRVREVGRGR